MILFLTLFLSIATAESLSPSVDFQISQYDPRLKGLFGKGNDSMLCWPSSLAHRMAYLQKHHDPPFAKLKLKTDPVENVAKFVSMCRTSASGGTSQKRKLPCIREAFREAGYSVDAFSLGPDAEKDKRAVGIQDLLTHLKAGYAVILHVAWWKQNAKTLRWEESGSHSLNAYGYDYKKEWGEERIVLKVVNPGENYAARPRGRMFDNVDVRRLEHKPSVSFPKLVELAVSGPGFNNPKRIAVVKNIFVFIGK